MHPGMAKKKLVEKRRIDAAIKAWREAELFAVEVSLAAEEAKALAWAVACPQDVRPAEAEDIRVGAIIWYPQAPDSVRMWEEVEFLLHMGDQHQAFIALGGQRRGLAGAFVEVD